MCLFFKHRKKAHRGDTLRSQQQQKVGKGNKFNNFPPDTLKIVHQGDILRSQQKKKSGKAKNLATFPPTPLKLYT